MPSSKPTGFPDQNILKAAYLPSPQTPSILHLK